MPTARALGRTEASATRAGARRRHTSTYVFTALRHKSPRDMPLRKPPKLSISLSVEKKQASFNLSDTGNFSVTTGKNGSFKVTLNASGGVASPLAKQEFPGLTLDQIEPLDELGAGAGGTVRLARHRPTGRPLALKIMHVTERQQRHMFLNELRVLCKIHHANLVPMYDCFQLDGIAYLALKYMDGGSLERTCAQHQAHAGSAVGLPEPVLASVALQALCGLAHLHERSLMHRDLKPANVLLDYSSGIVALADFGIAKEMDQAGSLMARSFVGTAAYMAPERLNGKEYRSSADLWSLGMIIIECAQGAHPWKDAKSYYDLVLEISECGHPPRLPATGGLFSVPLRELTASCLEPKADDRPTSRALLAHPFIVESLELPTRRPSAGGGAPAAVEVEIEVDDEATLPLPPPPEQCAVLAARRLAVWLARIGKKGTSSDSVGADDVNLLAECSEEESTSATRIQARLRGFQVRRDLAELRLLDQEVFGLDTQLQSSHAERQVVVDEQANAQIAELEHAQVLSIE